MLEEKDVIIDENKDNSIDTSNDGTSEKSDNSQENDKELETYKKRYSDSSRESKHITQVHKSYRQVLKDNSHFIELASSDSKLASEVFNQLKEDGYTDQDSVKGLISYLSGIDEDKSINKDELKKEIRQQILDETNKEQSDKILEDSLGKFEPKIKKLLLEEFKDVAGERKLTPAFTKKEIDKIIVYYKKDQNDDDRYDEVLSNLASNGLGGGKSVSKTSITPKKLSEMGIPKAEQKALYPELFTK